MEAVLAALRAAAEPTRLRLLSLCAQGELSVSDLVAILGQSQPRVSRHLKLMCEGGLLERFREGAWVFYRTARSGPGAPLAEQTLRLVPSDDPQRQRDDARLSAIKQARADSAARYFAENAARWAELRSLHVDDAEVERSLTQLLSPRPLGTLLDLGTGTGRMLELLGPKAEQAEGVDGSHEMLSIARAKLDAANLKQCSLRQGDLYALPFTADSFDSAILHQVLHFAESPAAVVAEAARVLRPRGRLVIVDFAPHELESLRADHNHRRLGFSDAEVSQWCAEAGLPVTSILRLPGQPLTVNIWLAEKPALFPGASS